MTLVNPLTPDTFIDGGGVIADVPLGEGTRIRFWIDEDRQNDISVFVKDNVLHVVGQYRPLTTVIVEENHVDVTTVKWNANESRQTHKEGR